ncbi:MAG TPA: hypothetical protein VGA39_03460 [Candidatus Acidoferrales bacterium]
MLHGPWAQVGLTDVTGGILVLLLAAALAAAGLFICAVSLYYRKWILFIVGLALMSPVLALVGYLFWEEIPRSYEWDFSADRSVARLEEEPVYGRYYYQGNIRSTIRLPGGRGWSGKAGLVTFQAESGQVDSIFWDSRALSTEEAYPEARRILGELRLCAPGAPASGGDDCGLDAWYQRERQPSEALAKEGQSFHAETPAGADPRVHLYTRRISPESEAPVWTIHVEVVWPE